MLPTYTRNIMRASDIRKHDAIINRMKKSIKKNRTMPKYIEKNNKVIHNRFKRDKEKQEKMKNEPENICKSVTKLTPKQKKKHRCACLNSNYYRCNKPVLYIHKNINKKNKRDPKKKNVPFCTRHIKMLLDSKDKKTLKYGYWFESDLYNSAGETDEEN